MSMQPMKSPSSLDMCNHIIGYGAQDYIYHGRGMVIRTDRLISNGVTNDEFIKVDSEVSSNTVFAGALTAIAAALLFLKGKKVKMPNAQGFSLPKVEMPKVEELVTKIKNFFSNKVKP